VRRDLAGEFDNFIYGRSENDETGSANGVSRCIGDLVTPGLCAQRLAHFGTARPDDNASGEATRMSGLGDRAAKQAGGENRQLIEHRDCKRERSSDVEFFGGRAKEARAVEIGLSGTQSWRAVAAP